MKNQTLLNLKKQIKMPINTNKNEVLIRFSAYGKWKPLDGWVDFENQSALIAYCLERFDDEKYIQLRVDGNETNVKWK